MTNFGLQQFSVVALGALHGTSAVTANAGLTTMLVLAAIGVLAGGWLAGRTPRHSAVAMIGMAMVSATCLLLAVFELPAVGADPGHVAGRLRRAARSCPRAT